MNRSCLLAALALALFAGCSGNTLNKDGSVILVYQVAEESKTPPQDVVEAIHQRLSHVPGHVEVKELDDGKFEVTLIGVSDDELKSAKEMLRANGELEFRIVALRGDDDALISAAQEGKPVEDKSKPHARWVSFDPDRCPPPDNSVTKEEDGKHWLLVIDDERDVTAQMVDYVRPMLEVSGWQVTGKLKPQGAALMQQLTSRNLPNGDKYRQLAIILDGEVISAPSITGDIRDYFAITGEFTEDDVRLIATVLETGQFPARLNPEPVSEMKVPPKN